ncbi:hypothetical protein GOP47_0025809 [Adiantum capillus-veneris]|uniref:Probable purine permease n=1 Tax=Adiantum capillus-veneris TaxID=13818 RepID=A0A9D4U217_ADICA|nr:hypothetical protein GOP47_0025809 [Adiantum capillus-veneris]
MAATAGRTAATTMPTSVTVKELALANQVSLSKLEHQGISMKGCSKTAESDYKEETETSTFFGKDMTYWVLMIASSAALVLGLSSGSLLGRYYYVHGGSRRWLYTWIQSAGWPVLIVPLVFGYWQRGPTTLLHMIRPRPTHSITPRLCFIYTVLGGLITFDNLLYSLGSSYLPVSTNSILCASQLAFNALFAYLLVGQKMSACILNSIVIISIGTILLGTGSGSDKPLGTTEREYILGIVSTIGASGLYALLLPLLQLVYASKDVQAVPCVATGIGRSLSTVRPTNTPLSLPNLETNVASIPPPTCTPSFLLVLEVQVAISAVASMFSFIGMFINGDLAAIHAEALHFDGGVLAYVMILVCSAIGWQLYFIGGSGIIFLSSSLMSCVFATVMIPILPVLAVIFFHDSFSATKGIAMETDKSRP